MEEIDPFQSWPEPWEGLPFEDAAWEWELESTQENGPTKHPPDARRGWKRWYFVYRDPTGKRIKVSADRDPDSGEWFNPHRSSGRI